VSWETLSLEADVTEISEVLAKWRDAEARVRDLQGNLLDGGLRTPTELKALQAARAAASTLLDELLITATDASWRHRPRCSPRDSFRAA